MQFEKFVDEVPTPQTAVDVFKGRWASALPGGLCAGESPLFDLDQRPSYALKAFGPNETSFEGAHILELGPLEGGHTFQLEKLGARVTAIEGNAEAFLKCLIVKELLDLQAKFSLGNFSKFFEQSTARFDLVFASGVLYHMFEPLELIAQIGKASDKAFVWTHYYDENLCDGFVEQQESVGGIVVPHFSKDYVDKQGGTFWGGIGSGARWLRQADIIAAFQRAGLDKVEILMDQPAGGNGPSMSFVATR